MPSRQLGRRPSAAPPSLKGHLRLTCGAVEDHLRLSGRPRRPFGPRIVPDRSTPWWFGRRRLAPDVVAAVLGETVGRVAGKPRGPRAVAPDSTGLRPARTSRRSERRAKRGRTRRGWPKRAPAPWVEPRMPLARRVRPGPAGGFGDPVPLAGAARAALPFDRPAANVGYGSEANRRFRRKGLGVDSPSPAKKRRSARVVAATPHRREMVWRLAEPGDEAGRQACPQR